MAKVKLTQFPIRVHPKLAHALDRFITDKKYLSPAPRFGSRNALLNYLLETYLKTEVGYETPEDEAARIARRHPSLEPGN
jgi:hypothetical protein